MSKGSISKKEKSDALKRHKENEKEEEEGLKLRSLRSGPWRGEMTASVGNSYEKNKFLWHACGLSQDLLCFA
jgi:hypothetical protein